MNKLLAEFLGTMFFLYVILATGDAVAIGLALMIISALWGHDLFGESGEIASTLVGASILSYGHIQNQKLCKLCCHN